MIYMIPKFTMIAKLDEECLIKVKTPCGETVLQGSVFGPIKCCVQIDTLEEIAWQKENACMYKYKNIVSVPPLALMMM